MLGILKLDFVICFTLACDWVLYMIEVLLDVQLIYCCCTGVLQAQVMSTSVQDRSNRLYRYGFSGSDSFPSWIFEGHHMNLDRVPSGDGYG